LNLADLGALEHRPRTVEREVDADLIRPFHNLSRSPSLPPLSPSSPILHAQINASFSQAMIDEFDLDQDGEINEQEFVQIMMDDA